MATYTLAIDAAVMIVDAESKDEALSECDDILSGFLSDWASVTVIKED